MKNADSEQIEKKRRKRKIKPRPCVARTLPPGITLLAIRHGANKPFGVQWIVGDDRPQAYFATTGELVVKIDELLEARREGEIALVPSRADIASWREFKRAIGDTPPHEVIAGWMAWRDTHAPKKSGLKVSAAVADYMKLQLDRLNNKPDRLLEPSTYSQKRLKLTRFADRFGAKLLADVTGPEIKTWAIEELPKLLGMATVSRDFIKDHIKKASELYQHYRKEVPDNPTKTIELGKDTREKPDAIAASKLLGLLLYALENDRGTLCRLTCEVFAGVRPSTVARLMREDINLVSKSLTIRKRAIKTVTRHYITTMPPVFWEWMQAGWDHPDAFHSEIKSDWMHRKTRLLIAARIPIPRNSLRHAFPSYHVAVNESADKTALIMCHEGAKMLWDRYVGKADKGDGERLFSATPANVRTLIDEQLAIEDIRLRASPTSLPP